MNNTEKAARVMEEISDVLAKYDGKIITQLGEDMIIKIGGDDFRICPNPYIRETSLKAAAYKLRAENRIDRAAKLANLSKILAYLAIVCSVAGIILSVM